MKCHILLKSLFVISVTLYFGFSYAKQYKNQYDEFFSIAAKDVPGLPLITSFLQADEIPEFISAMPEDKKRWNKLATRMDELTKIFAEAHKKFEANPMVIHYRTTQDFVR